MNSNFFAFAIFLASVSSCLFTDVSGWRQKCLGNYCSGTHAMKAVCKDGYCVCNSQDYDYNTCLPDAYGCKIEINSETAFARPWNKNQHRPPIYSCTPGNSSTLFEVHVLTMHKVSFDRRPSTAHNAVVNIVNRRNSTRPIILVLGSDEPVNWILNLPGGLTISKVILVFSYLSYYVESTVSRDLRQVQAIERKSYAHGYGSDAGGGDTAMLLRQVHDRFGVVTSFTGTYRAEEWSLVVGSSNGSGNGNLSIPLTPAAAALLPRQKCFESQNRPYYCPGQNTNVKADCIDGYCVCTGRGYVYETCLPDAYGCKIEVNSATALAKPRYNKRERQAVYSCTPAHSSTQYEVHVLAMGLGGFNNTAPRIGYAMVNIVSRRQSNRPVVLVLGTYVPVNWFLNIPPDIFITKLILVGSYLNESSVRGDVDQVKAIERKSTHSYLDWKGGYGNDSLGGDTVGLLKELTCNEYGVVTSFTGTHRADEWLLVVGSSDDFNRQGSTQSQTRVAQCSSSASGYGTKRFLGFLVIILMMAII